MSRNVPFELARSEGDRAAFTKDEVRRALELIGVPSDQLDTAVTELYDVDPAGGILFDETLFTALGRLSDECAARVAGWLGESPESTAARIDRFEAELRKRGLRK